MYCSVVVRGEVDMDWKGETSAFLFQYSATGATSTTGATSAMGAIGTTGAIGAREQPKACCCIVS